MTGWATSISAGPSNESTQIVTLLLSNDNNALFSVQPSLDASGNLSFTPASDAYGVAVVTITITDDGGTVNGGDNVSSQTFIITVNPVNDKPVAVADNFSANEDTAVSYNVAANDTDNDGTIDPSTVDLNPGTAGIDQSVTKPEGTWTVNNTGVITFTPALNYNGTASITYSIKDNGGATSDAGTITINITPVNDAVVIGNDNFVTNEDTSLTVNITNNDTDVDGTVDAATVDLDASVPGIQHTITNATGTWTVDNSGNLSFTPKQDFNGTASISYTVADNTGAVSLPGNITVMVNAVNDNPVAIADNVSTSEDISVTFNPTLNDSDVDGTLDLTALDLNPATAGIQHTVTTSEGVWTADNAGNVTFVPKTNFNGLATVSYTVKDNSGGNSNAVLVSVTVTPVNDQPILVEKKLLVTQGRGATDNLLTGAIDPDGTPLSINVAPISGPLHGTITIKPDGTYIYIADPVYAGSDEVVVEICDNGLPLPALCSQLTLQITIVANQAPVVSTKYPGTLEDAALSGTLIGAPDIDPEGLPLKVNTTPIDGPSHGSIVIQADGKFTYTPEENYHGKDTVKVTVCDSNPVPACSNMDVIFTISPVNDAPVLVDVSISGERNAETTGNVIAGDSDPDGTPLLVNTTPVTPPAHGTIVIDASGNFVYTPDRNFVGEDRVVIEVCDSGDPLPAICATTTLTIVITDPLAGIVFVPEGFSPNGDHINDSFEITYTGDESIQLQIFNRWGNLVYSNDAYQNDWQGISTHGITIGKELPDGTYFYKVTIGEFQQVKSFTLKR